MWGKELNGKEAEAAVPTIGLPHATNVAEVHQNGTTESSNSAVEAGNSESASFCRQRYREFGN